MLNRSEVSDYARRMFPDDNNGSRVMLTTRLADVAAYADSSSHFHEMNLMDAHQSWDLLRHKVFMHEYCPPELDEIGKEIASSCRGLPLAIVVIAGLLSNVSNTRGSWEQIAENVTSVIATREEQFEKIMSLSYTHLPQHLRPCFLYMGVFPEDYEIRVSRIIKLWVAEGFLKPIESKSFEETAEEYLEDLVKRNLVLVSTNGKIKSCSIHDLMRELCIRKAEQDKIFVHVRDRGVPKRSIENQRRLCINQSCSAETFRGQTIRTMIMLYQHIASLGDYLRNCRLLRILDVVDAYVKDFTYDQLLLTDQMLRYLALDSRMEIPAGISNLQNLQTLIIHPKRKHPGRPSRVRLPLEIWRMPQLRHLACFYFDELPYPEEEGEINCGLENLQTFSGVRNLKCSRSTLRMIPNVNKLGIVYFGIDEHDEEDYHLENLVYLHQLEKLKLIVDGDPRVWLNKVNVCVFPMMLKKLTLSSRGMPWGDMMRIAGSLPNLQVLKLRDSFTNGDKWETTDGGFPQLKFLLIDFSYLEHWITESSHFPRLERLLLHRCWMLTEIPEGIGDIPTLELIEAKYCQETLAESARRIQEEQQANYGNDAFEVRCVHCNR